ncbi:MAG: glycosyltransferase family 39 protein [Abditibacteriaceae bacterium]
MKLAKVLLYPIGIFLIAAIVRLIGIRWGLPDALHWYSYHPDEYQIFSSVANLDFFNGKFDPHFFNYPSLYIYLVYITHFLLSGFGIFTLNANDPNFIWQWPQQILLTARWLSALFGAGTAVLVFAIIKSWRPKLHIVYAVFGGLLMAFVPGHVQHSHFATVDVAATFFVALSLWLAVYIQNSPHPTRTFLWSCFVAGLAAATKYNAGIVVLAPLCVLFLEERLRSHIKVLLPALIGSGFVGFVIGCPYSVLNFKEFWGDGQNTGVAYELLVHPHQGQGDVFIGSGNGWIYHLTFNLPFVLTWSLLLLCLFGILRICVAKGISKQRWLLLIFVGVFFLSLGFSQVRFMRYVLPLVPPLIVFAVFGARWLKVLLGKKFTTTICSFILLITFWGSANVLSNFVSSDPRTQAAEFMQSNVNAPTTVGVIDVPRFWSPPLAPQDVIFGSTLTLVDIEKTEPNQHFHFDVTGFEITELQQQKPLWFVMSEFEWRDEKRLRPRQYNDFMETLQKEYQLQESYKNHPWLALPGRASVPHDFLYTNPEIQIYKRK